MITQVDTFVKIHEDVNLFMHVAACESHLQKELLAQKSAGHNLVNWLLDPLMGYNLELDKH